GVSAALLSVTLSRILSPIAGQSSMLRVNENGAGKHKIVSPAEVADNLNNRFQLDPETGQYFTLIYGILNTETYEFRFVNAGHPHPFLLSQGKCSSPQRSSGLPIGFVEEQAYGEKTVQLKPGDRIYFYSDGITETMRNDEQFGVDRLKKLAQQDSSESLKNHLDSIVNDVQKFGGSEKFADDISIMAIEIKEAP
ncbi:MAG: PP2C family protein-serine/threonine phosphatase, partial [Calditrichaeota bacterium]|nr:PP2C family protein-serine/threonine phosphatase [Calditrichota bacterium]